tara:strand:+ start:15209 stop:17119 length:1911 start_codon:yes stop_codon:yes gene_type:complete
MAVKRYFANSDNTITNAFEENLTTRATGSNMGASDILEVFSIYAQSSASSGLTAEKSRALIKFNATASTNSILADRSDGILPSSGSVSFYLRMFNAPHSQTLPKNFTMDVTAVSGGWEEGTGLDMEAYKDKDASNWVNAVGTNAAATSTATITVFANMDAGETLTLISTDGTTVVATASSTTTTTNDTNTPTFRVLTDAPTTAANLKTCIDANSKFTATVLGAAVTITQATAGRAGNTVAVVGDTVSTVGMTVTSPFSGGDGAWATEGGDYYGDISSSFSASFTDGTEDIEVNITTLVEQWLNSAGNVLGSKKDEGIGVFVSKTYEDAARSYYTKKFFGKGTEFYFKRPCVEARWNSATKDDRGNFFYSSSLATAKENLNTIYLYNYFRGQLRNIPAAGTGRVYVSFFSGTATDTTLDTTGRLKLVGDGTHVSSNSSVGNQSVVTGGYVSTGIYSASVCLTASASPLKTIYDVWFTGSDINTSNAVIYHTGSLKPNKIDISDIAPATEYISNITNLKSIYRGNETARFRVYSRQKDWSPTIYTKATAQAEVNIVESGSYEIYRVVDDLKIVPYGTGSDLHTQMSIDTSGSYFDLDMRMLEPGYMYGINLAYYNYSVSAWVEQTETFKFRVESRQSN